MKFLFVLFTLLPSLPAFAQAPLWDGTFARDHQIGFLSYGDAASCQADQGVWSDDGVCLFAGSDTVTVKRTDQSNFTVAVSTVTTNGHTCDFEGNALIGSERQLVASVNTQTYVQGSDPADGTSGQMVDTFCEVTVTYLDDNTVSVATLSPVEQCQSLCGANAGLDINTATRR